MMENVTTVIGLEVVFEDDFSIMRWHDSWRSVGPTEERIERSSEFHVLVSVRN